VLKKNISRKICQLLSVIIPVNSDAPTIQKIKVNNRLMRIKKITIILMNFHVGNVSMVWNMLNLSQKGIPSFLTLNVPSLFTNLPP